MGALLTPIAAGFRPSVRPLPTAPLFRKKNILLPAASLSDRPARRDKAYAQGSAIKAAGSEETS
jgi:hypothetical protein